MTAPQPAAQGTLHAIAVHLVRALQPLDEAFRDAESFEHLMFQLGWQVQGLPPEYVTVADQVLHAAEALAALRPDPSAGEILGLIGTVGDVYRSVSALSAAPPGVDPAAFLPEIGRRLFEYLLARDLLTWKPRWFGLLHSLGVIAFENTPAAGTRPAFMRWRFDWDQIPAVFSDPGLIPARLYGWGTPTFLFAKLATVLAPLLNSVGVPVRLQLVGPELSAALQKGATGTPAGPVHHAMVLPLFDVPLGSRNQPVGFTLSDLPAEGAAMPGMILQIMAPNGLTETVDLGDGWTFTLRAGTDLAQQLAVVIRPGETSVRYPFAPGQALPSAGLGMSLAHKSDPATLLFGQKGKTRLELASAALNLAVDEKAGEVEVSAGATLDGLVLVLNTSDLDGFLGSALGGHEVTVPLQLGVSWSSRTGLSFLAGAGFGVTLYPHLDLGLIRFDRVDLAVRLVAGPGTPELDVQALVSFSGVIGPVSYTVEQIGAQLTATLADGDAGPFGLDLSPVWPTGLGLAIDAGPIKGGGFISFDRAKGRYVGILQVDVFAVGVTAIGVLDTRDGAGAPLPPPGYSFVLIIAARIPHIQLGYGFTLNAVGGVAALNRRLDTAAVLAGIRQGGLQRILFPADPVRDANAIVAGIGAIFPIAMGRYVFGPTAVIGWGTPTLITINLAIVVEVPAPVTLTLLGQLSVVLPNAHAPIVELHVDVIGVLDPGKRTLAVDASLHDSKVAGFALTGDLALRVAYGDQPAFALAIGGFNPHFTPPPGFPTLRRVTVALGQDDNPRVSLEGYHAITSNSRQFGAKAELYAAAGGFNVHGWLSFDALLTLFPLSFRFDFSVGMSLNHGSSRIAGVTVKGTLTGPDPFHVWGEGSLSLLFFDISVPFDARFGLSILTPALAPADPWPLLSAAIGLLDNWAVDALSTAAVSMVSTGPAGPLLDPSGAATLRQKVLPLWRTLEMFGQYAISGPDTFAVAQVNLDGRAAHFAPVTDFFVPGDFEKLSATDQLSRDSFEVMDAGVRIDNGIQAPVPATKVATLAYQTKIIDSSWRSRPLPLTPLGRPAQLAAAESGAVGRAATGRARFARRDGRTAGIVLDPEAYTVASTDTLAPRPEIAAGLTKGAARSALRRSTTTGLQVLPSYETSSETVADR
jgi:hypothetical protein